MIDKRVPLEKFDIKKSFSPMLDMGFFVNGDKVPFNTDLDRFDFTNAWWMADHARLSYINNQILVKQKLTHAGYTDVKFIWNEKTGTKVYITWDDEHIVVCFTGTEFNEGREDILTDLNFLPKKSSRGGVVHTGFSEAFDSIYDELNLFLLIHGDGKSIWITGHSLGAALAVIAASKFDAKGCYTFGSPRVGSAKFNKAITTPIYRIAKNNDVVTRVPTPPIYKHGGDLYFITDDQRVLKNPPWCHMFKERLGGTELKILWLLFKVFVLKSPMDFISSYLHGHSPYNYSVFMWNNIDK